MDSEEEEHERLVGRITIKVLWSLFVAALALIPLFGLFAIAQGFGLVREGIDPRPTLIPIALVAGFLTIWVGERHSKSR